MNEPNTSQPLRLILCNAPEAAAARIAEAVVRQKLAACVNVLRGVASTYFWQEKLCVETESTLIMKTRADLVGPLTAAVRAMHPYQVPEVISLPIFEGEGNADYLAWVRAETLSVPPASTST